jgi:hypothetical protein
MPQPRHRLCQTVDVHRLRHVQMESRPNRLAPIFVSRQCRERHRRRVGSAGGAKALIRRLIERAASANRP